MTSSRIEIAATFRNSIPHLIHDGILYYSQKNNIYAIPTLERPEPTLLGTIPWGFRDLPSHIRLADRVLKKSILQLHRSSDGVFLVLTGHGWWRIDAAGKAVQLTPPSMTRPMSRGICAAPDGTTYVAEYTDNPQRAPVKIYKSNDLQSFDACWEFPAGSIRHIHGIVCDEEIANRIWILTGDENHESAIWYTDNGFSSVEVFLQIGQLSRLVDLITVNGLLQWGTDSPTERNFIMQCAKNRTAEPAKVQDLPGPAYYSSRNEAGAVYFGTTVEPGPAVLDEFGHIFGSTPPGGWEEIFRARKDRTPQHGVIYFPRGVLPDNYLVFSKRALKPGEGCMYIARDRAWSNR